VVSTSFHNRGPNHFLHQPFGQIPWITEGEISVFESGAILLYLGEKSEVLLPSDAKRRAEVTQWLFAALNSVEMPAVPWTLFKFASDESTSPGRQHLDGFLSSRLDHIETHLEKRNWLCEDFSLADIAMVDVLRLVDRFGLLASRPASRAYINHAMDRPAFKKALSDQFAHFAAADGVEVTR
jgi:glutathione S-transferase